MLDGLEVKVAFNGVWKETLTDLSGGQRSLLALSLILAMLLFKPAPMYILDEIDAALDLSHTQNIGAMIRTHFSKSQFIVVSLKQGLFNNANVIFRTKFVEVSQRRVGRGQGAAPRSPSIPQPPSTTSQPLFPARRASAPLSRELCPRVRRCSRSRMRPRPRLAAKPLARASARLSRQRSSSLSGRAASMNHAFDSPTPDTDAPTASYTTAALHCLEYWRPDTLPEQQIKGKNRKVALHARDREFVAAGEGAAPPPPSPTYHPIARAKILTARRLLDIFL